MIFSTLFKANWQSKKVNIRLNAVNDELQLSNTEQVTILTNIAKSDSSFDVRKAALLKLNNIDLYIELLKNEHNSDHAFIQLQIESFLLANNNNVDVATKHQLIELLSITYLEQWLAYENNIDIAKALYQKINKPQHVMSAFNKSFTDNSMSESFQLFLLSNVNDITLLEKLTKKTTLAPVKQYINQKITELTEIKEKPILLSKSIQLLLSKLLALKESKVPFIELSARRTDLQAQWHKAQSDFNCLPKEQSTTYTEKYIRINTQLDKVFAPLKEQYEQEKIAQALILEKATAKQEFNDTINELEQKLANAVFENKALIDSPFEQKLTELPQIITSSVLNENEQQIYLNKLSVLQAKLQKLPEIAKSVTDATHLISKISQLAIPKDMNEMLTRSTIFYDWLNEWKVIEKQSVGTLPNSIKNAKSEIVKQWKAGLAPFEREQKELFNQVQKYITDIKRLIVNGKFNPCFGLYKKLKTDFVLLPVNQQQKLQRGFDQVTDKLDDLSDWEQYIATPKKQELLNKIKRLVDNSLSDLNEQANLVKQYRKQWNSLGHAEDNLEKTLNDEFNQFCEQAFVPCRAFYAEQELKNQKHANQRLQVIEHVNHLVTTLTNENSNDSTFYKALDAQLNKIHKVWREAGEVDKKQYHQLQKQYKNALSPIKQKTNEYHQRNIELKQKIIEQANACYHNDNAFTAVNEIKNLQQQWRTIGYAGPKQDNTLWQTFRSVNDSVFAKRDAVKSEQQSTQSNLAIQYELQMNELKNSFSILKTVEDHQQVLAQIKTLLTQVYSTKPVIKTIANQLESLSRQVELSIVELEQCKKQKQWIDIFSVVTELSKELSSEQLSTNANFQVLPNFWQKKLIEAHKQTRFGDRVEKTLELEILGKIDSPTEYANERLVTQVRLLQEQMLSSGSIDLKALFIDWLLCGKFTESDEALINRVKRLYC